MFIANSYLLVNRKKSENTKVFQSLAMPANQLQKKFYETGSVYEDDEKFSGVQNGMFHLAQRHGSKRATCRNSRITCITSLRIT